MTRRQRQARISAIIRELTRLSRDGWNHAHWIDYLSLERELKELQS